MADGMDPIRIDIPTPKATNMIGEHVMQAVREAGMSPRKAIVNPMARAVIQSWGRNEMTRSQVVHALRNLLIMNPSLAMETP